MVLINPIVNLPFSQISGEVIVHDYKEFLHRLLDAPGRIILQGLPIVIGQMPKSGTWMLRPSECRTTSLGSNLLKVSLGT
jgi:hypothetical protein